MSNNEPTNKRRKFTGMTREERIKLIISHRMTLLTWLCVLLQLNRLCNISLVRALLLSHTSSLVSCKFPLPRHSAGKDSGRKTVNALLEWWNKVFRVSSSSFCPLCSSANDAEAKLRDTFLEGAASLTGCRDMKWALFVALGRSIGLETRLIMQLRTPISRKIAGELGFGQLWCEYRTWTDESWTVLSEHLEQRPLLEAGRAQSPLDYVLGISAEGVEDVTAKYVPDFLSRHHRLRQRFVGISGCEDWQKGWWKSVLQLLGNIKPSAVKHHVHEKMPTTLPGFKSHPLFVLERHIPKNHSIVPGTSHIGLFKGEKVFPRSALAALKSKQAWWLLGREILPKHLDPNTTLYPDYQTRMYSAPLLAGEKIPRNKHGSFDLFQPNMLPADAVHVTTPDAAAVARRLGLDYARAVVGFQHGASGALPIENGIVLSETNASLLKDALSVHHSSAVERENERRYSAAIRNWKAYIRFLEIKLRLQEDYGD
ncbi:hypothetical protein DSO57_1004122 [Entomophthora muscae]|nr:hypothetical protein DSO57_1004122 [Entomophthora muscae]